MKTRTLRDLGVGRRKSVGEIILDFVSLCKGLTLTEKQKCLLAIPCGFFGAYFVFGLIHCFMIVKLGYPDVTSIALDWWWMAFR